LSVVAVVTLLVVGGRANRVKGHTTSLTSVPLRLTSVLAKSPAGNWSRTSSSVRTRLLITRIMRIRGIFCAIALPVADPWPSSASSSPTRIPPPRRFASRARCGFVDFFAQKQRGRSIDVRFPLIRRSDVSCWVEHGLDTVAEACEIATTLQADSSTKQVLVLAVCQHVIYRYNTTIETTAD